MGVNGGVSVGQNRTTDTTVLPGNAFPVFGADSVSRAPFGGTLGAQVGWNWQAAPSWLLGVEADAQWSGQSDSACVSACLPAGAGGALSSAASFSHDRVGWTLGGGVEAPLAGNWTAKAE